MVHVRAGFRAIFRQPALVLGEIAWRWAFGVAAWMLVIARVHRILTDLDVSRIESLIASRSDAFLIADAAARILVQVLPQFARESVVLVLAICVLWIVAATLGRSATLNALAGREAAVRPTLGRLTLLNTLRTLFTLATAIAFVGALLLAGSAMPALNPTVAAMAWIVLAAVIALFWSMVNWFLALAPIWMVREGGSTLRSIANSVELFRRNPGAYSAISGWFGLLRTAGMVGMVIAGLVAAAAPPASAIALGVVIALTYFAFSDLLYIARMAAFLDLEESNHRPALGIPQPISDPLMPASAPPAISNG